MKVLTLEHSLLGSGIVSLLKLAVDRYNAIALNKLMPSSSRLTIRILVKQPEQTIKRFCHQYSMCGVWDGTHYQASWLDDYPLPARSAESADEVDIPLIELQLDTLLHPLGSAAVLGRGLPPQTMIS
jgi:hypothetical protein